METSAIWQNSIACLASREKAYLHSDAKEVIEAVTQEWKRRSLLPFDPNEYFKWPTIEAPVGYGGISTQDWPKIGLLAFLGYRVGRTDGKPDGERRLILSSVFETNLPPIFIPIEMAQWGTPLSANRLRKMAEALAAFTRNGKRRRDDRMADAITDWKSDLRFLHQTYYVNKFHFAFPTTTV